MLCACVLSVSLLLGSHAADDAPRPAPARPVLETRFTAKHAITVLVNINDRERAWFILDTGAARTQIDTTLAAKLGLETHPAPYQTDRELADGVTIELCPGAAFTVDNVGIRPISSYTDYYGLPIVGLLGMDVISKVVMKIDYDAQMIELVPRDEVDAEPGEWFTMTTWGQERGSLFTRMALSAGEGDERQDCVLAIDSAIPTAIQVFDDTPQADALERRGKPAFEGVTPLWTGPGWCDVDVHLPEGGFSRSTCVELTQRHPLAFETMHGFLGAAFLANQSPVMLDAENGTIKLTRTARTGDLRLGGRARGMALMAFSPYPGEAYVQDVAPRSAAALAGMLANDRIVGVDDLRADADVMRWLPTYLDIVREREVVLDVLRDNRTIEVRIGPARNCVE